MPQIPDDFTSSAGQPIKQEAEILAAKLEQITRLATTGAAQGGEAWKSAIESIRRDLELYLLPAFAKAKLDPKLVSDSLKQFGEMEKIVTRYHQIVGTKVEQQAEKVRKTLNGQLTDIEKYYALLQKKQLEASSSETERLEIIKRINKERTEAVGQHTTDFRKNQAGEFISGGARTLMDLAGVGSIAALLSMLSSVAAQQVAAGSAIARVTGRAGTVGETAQTGLEAGFRTFGGLATPGLGGMTPGDMNKALQILEDLSPQLVASGQSVESLIVPLVHFGKTTSEAVAIIGEASARIGGTEEAYRAMATNLDFGTKLATKFGTDAVKNFKMVDTFAASLRATGVSATLASAQAREWSYRIQEAGHSMKLGQAEIEMFAAKFQGAISSMSTSQAAGLVLATTGRMPTSLKALSDTTGAHSGELFQNVYRMLEKGAGAQGQMFVPEAFAQQMGLGSVNIQTAELIRKAMAAGGGGMAELQAKGVQGDSANLAEARNKLVVMEGAMTVIQRIMEQIVQVFVPDMAQNLTILKDVASGNTHLSADTLKGFFNRDLVPQKGLGRLDAHHISEAARQELNSHRGQFRK